MKEDIEGDEWVKNVATKKFYNEIEKHAGVFKKEFFNSHFADDLIKNKLKIGEQPFAWLEHFDKMKKLLERLMSMKNIAIENAKVSLTNLFKNRIYSLESSINRLALQLQQISVPASENANLIKEINEGFRRIELSINKLWKQRKKMFRKIKGNIDKKSLETLPLLNNAIAVLDISFEADILANHVKSNLQFISHKDKLVDIIRIPNSKKIPHLLMLAFDFARIGENFEKINEQEKKLLEKDKNANNYDYAPIKKSVIELIGMYYSFIDWTKSIGFNLKIDYVVERVNRLKGEQHG